MCVVYGVSKLGCKNKPSLPHLCLPFATPEEPQCTNPLAQPVRAIQIPQRHAVDELINLTMQAMLPKILGDGTGGIGQSSRSPKTELDLALRDGETICKFAVHPCSAKTLDRKTFG